MAILPPVLPLRLFRAFSAFSAEVGRLVGRLASNLPFFLMGIPPISARRQTPGGLSHGTRRAAVQSFFCERPCIGLL
jgi:hypothetical protein